MSVRVCGRPADFSKSSVRSLSSVVQCYMFRYETSHTKRDEDEKPLRKPEGTHGRAKRRAAGETLPAKKVPRSFAATYRVSTTHIDYVQLQAFIANLLIIATNRRCRFDVLLSHFKLTLELLEKRRFSSVIQTNDQNVLLAKALGKSSAHVDSRRLSRGVNRVVQYQRAPRRGWNAQKPSNAAPHFPFGKLESELGGLPRLKCPKNDRSHHDEFVWRNEIPTEGGGMMKNRTK